MKARFTFLSGSRAGQTDIFGQPHISIGRHPQCELRFDADADLDVSSRHASVTLNGDLYVLRDLGSTNGTFVNGKRLTGDHLLATKDVVRFGPSGPTVEFTAIGVGRPGPATPPAAAAEPPGTVVFGHPDPAPPAPPPQLTPEQLRSPRRTPGPGTNTRIQVAVRTQTRTLRRVAMGLALLCVVAAGAYFWKAAESERRLAAQRAAMLAQVDTLMQEMGTVTSGSAGLRAALDSARADAERLRHQLTQAPNDAARIAQLEQQLAGALRQQRTLAGAAALDARGIAAKNREALAMVFVQFPSGRVYTGTAFAVQSDPLGGLLVTNKHVVIDSTGEPASRIGVVFEGTRQNFKADLVATSDNADLALIRASVHRGFPTVQGLADSAREISVGDPAAILGFPLGLDLAGGEDWTQVGVAATLTLGTVSRTLPTLLQLDSYGAQGASGSPIFNSSGRVIGVLYGGEAGSNGRIIYSVPIRFVHRLLEGQ